MRKAHLPLGLMVSLASLSACGPAPAPVAPKPTESAKTAPKVVAADDDGRAPGGGAATRGAMDLGPVPEPLIVGMGRWKSPAATMSSLSSCSGAPPQLIEGNSKKLADLILRDSLGGAIDTQELASIVAMDAPIDFAVALDSSGKRRDVFAAVSVGLTSLERAKGAIEGRERGAPPVEIAPGMWRIGDRDNTDASCAITAAAGTAPARLICGDRDRDLVALGPYLARNAPLVALAGGDIHGEGRFRPLIDRFGADMRQQLKSLPLIAESQLSIGDQRFDRAVSDAAVGLQGEFTALLGDLDKVSFDVGVDPATCLSASGSIELRGSASWLAGTISDRATERNGPPPSLFWQLPKDSDMAFYGRGADPARFSAILQTLRALAEGAMTKLNIGNAADRKALAALLSMPLGKDANTVQASGHIDSPSADSKKGAGEQQVIDSLMKGWLGWNLIGVDQGPEAVTKILKDFVAAYTRQAALAVAFDKAQKKEREAQADLLRKGKQLTIEDIEAREKKLPPRSLLTPIFEELDADASFLPTIKTVAAPASLGKGATAIELKIEGIPSLASELGMGRPDGGKPAKKASIQFVGHILLMVDDKSVWIAIGTDKDELVKRLLSVKSDAPAAGKLSSRASLEVLKNGKFVSGGFATLVPLTKAATSAMMAVGATMGSGGVPPEVQEMIRVITTLPHRGEAPIFFTTETTGGGAPKASMSFKVSQAVMEDLGALVMGGLKIASHMRP